MHRSESEDLTPCASCGDMITPGPERGFAFGAENVLCWQCAVRRGGSYDATQERWVRAPHTDDLPVDEE